MYSNFVFILHLQLIMGVSVNGLSISSANSAPLPPITHVISLADSQDKTAFALAANIKDEPMDVESIDTHKDEVGLIYH